MANQHAGGFNPLSNNELGWPYLIYYTLLNLACVLTWQTTISRLLSAKDAKTGQQVYTRTAFFFACRFLIPAIWGIAALACLTPADLSGLAAQGWDPTIHGMPLYLSRVVPVGLMGLLVAAMLAADMSSTSSYMLTWGSVIYNDILAPFRKTRWSERRGLLWNRAIVTLIGFFLFFYGLLYPLKGNVWDYLAITGTIYLASMSTLLIACCYWRRANNWGAGGAILVGAVIPLTYLAMQLIPRTADLAASIGKYYFGIAAFSAAAVAMVVGSLLKPAAAQQALAEPQPRNARGISGAEQ
jgi:SSS family solute:Na+ symporter